MAKKQFTPTDTSERHSQAHEVDNVAVGNTPPEVKRSEVRRFPTHIPVRPIEQKPKIIVEFPVKDLPSGGSLEYPDGERERGLKPKPPRKEYLLKDQRLQALFEFLMAAPAEVLDAQVEFARKQGATFSFSQAATDAGVPASTPVLAPRPADAPPLWAERTTGREVSPVAWIRMHYGNKDPNPDNWDPMGLTRGMIRQIDRPLYQAFCTYVSRATRAEEPTPSGFDQLFESPRHRVDTELQLVGIENPTDAYKATGLDRATAERLYQAARRRQLRS